MSAFGAPNLLDLVDEDGRAMLARLGNRVHYRSGETVHDRGDVGTALGIVITGQVNLYRIRANGTLVYTSAVEAGQNFGDVVSMTEGVRTHHAVAHGPTVVDHFGRAQMALILQDFPAITRALYLVSSYRLKTAIEMLDDARMLPTEVRLAKMLRRMAQVDGNRGEVLALQDSLSQVLGLSSVSVAHALKSLSQSGLVETGYRRISLPDLTALDNWLLTQDWE